MGINLENYKLLTDAFLSNKGIGYMAEIAFQVFQNPVLIVDTSFRILAGCEDSSEQLLDARDLSVFREAHMPELLATEAGPCSYHHPVFDCLVYAAGIRVRNTVVAYLLIPERLSKLKESSLELINTFRDLLSQELMKKRSFQQGRDEYMSYLLMDMLTNKYPDEKTIQKRFETVDFRPADHMNIAVFRKRLENSRGCSMELIAMQLLPILTGHISAVVEDDLVLLFNFQEGKKLDTSCLDMIEQVCTNNDLIAGISSSFSSLSDLVKHYRLATRTALVCQRYIEDHRVIFYDDVFDLALLEYCDRHNHLMDFVHSSILRLMEYDSRYGTDYLYTFWIYTECGCNTQEAAARLFIHKNTLVYRVNKIKELLESDLTSGKDMFAFQLSMRILRMLGKLEK